MEAIRQPSASEAKDPATSTGTESRRWRAAFWLVLLLGAVAVLALASHFRTDTPSKEDNAAFSLSFPDGYSKARSLRATFAIANPHGSTVILNSHRNTPPLAVHDAKRQLRHLSCSATPQVRRTPGQTTVTTIAPRPCQLFESAAIVFGPDYRVSVACSAPKHAQAVTACRQTLAGLRVK